MWWSCYDAVDEAVFHAHRDSTTFGTAHRRFACSINLNGGFEGGDLRFPEYGPATYRPPLGGAVVFSCALMHEATRVTAGRRYAFLPFFYDEAGARTSSRPIMNSGSAWRPEPGRLMDAQLSAHSHRLDPRKLTLGEFAPAVQRAPAPEQSQLPLHHRRRPLCC